MLLGLKQEHCELRRIEEGQDKWEEILMWVIAHRGGGELFAENTLTAFIQSEALGVDLVECDVHLSRDGQLMVIHDETLERTGARPVQVAQLTAKELRQIDVGDGLGVPTLPALLEAIHIPVVVELKTPKVVAALLTLLQDNPPLIERIAPISFFHDAIKTLSDHFPRLQTGILLVGVPVDLPHMAKSAHTQMLALHHQLINRTLVDEIHRQNLLVTVWTPNSEADIQQCVDIGVDGISSDRPDRVLASLGRA